MDMLNNPIKVKSSAARSRHFVLRAALVLILLCVALTVCLAQTTVTAVDGAPAPTPRPIVSDTPQAPLTERERAMLELIKGLQARVTKLEAQVGAPTAQPVTGDEAVMTDTEDPVPTAATEKAPPQREERKEVGSYTPNLGFKLADTKYGDLNVSIY